MAAPSVVPSIIRSLVLLVVAILLFYILGKWILWLFGVGNQVQRNPVMLQVEDRSVVNVSLEGGLLQRAEDALKLYVDDRVTTGGNGHARLSFFDDSFIRMDVQSDLTIEESTKGTNESEWSVTLPEGALWVRTPDIDTYSGSILRTIATAKYDVELTSDTEAIVEQGMLMVFRADGNGVTVHVHESGDDVMIGEGQQFTIPDGTIVGDPLRMRSAIEPLALQRDFIEQSRTLDITEAPLVNGTGAQLTDDVLLDVTEPADRQQIATPTVTVRGRVGSRVERVRVNGYDATINRQQGAFSQELSIEADKDTQLLVEALDARGIVLERISRTVRRGATVIAPPTITTPAGNGSTYRTQQQEFSISGTAPANTAGIMVNDYQLQLFQSNDRTWSYLASTALNNLHSGTNVYDVYALDTLGNKSAPVRITILLEEGSEGVISSGTGSSSTATTVEEADLPQNDPLMPGTITVTGPQAGSSYTATGSEFLLEGAAPSAAASVWVNGYKLQLFKAGGGYWNYIAKTEYNTLKPGTNVYRIVARNAENQILDMFEYTVTYNP